MIADPLSVGDLVMINEKFMTYLYSPKRYEGIGIVTVREKVYKNEIYEVYFNGWTIKRVPRHWLIKMGCSDTTLYCPIEEEWKLWGDI